MVKIGMLCPKCHRPFTQDIEKKEFISENTTEGNQFAGSRSRGPYPLDVPRELETYKYYYKCKHCGHEWMELKEFESFR